MEYPKSLAERPLCNTASRSADELVDRGFIVLEGLDKSIAEELVEKSKEEHILEYCPNDATDRFSSVQSIERWISKGRQTFSLFTITRGVGELAGFGWMGPGKPGNDEPELLDAKTTFAIRLYSSALGKGNSLPFTLAMLCSHHQQYGNRGVWLEAWSDNIKALRTYRKAGFITVAAALGIRHNKELLRHYMQLNTNQTPGC